ncbi:MAG TPA: hypothetical protein ENK09_04075 [Nitrospirae bacterium]|nr:hypothetical protein [Nitrospirota bacterium]
MRRAFIIIMVLTAALCIYADTTAASTAEDRNGYIRYDPAGRRDPFLSILVLTKQRIEKKKRHSKNPLENVDITEVKLLGVVKKGNKYFASVLLPDGKAFTITKGTPIGLYNGKVIDIRLDRLVVREYVMDYRGRIKPKDIILKLRKEEE